MKRMNSFHTIHYTSIILQSAFWLPHAIFLFLQCMLVRNEFVKTGTSLTRRTCCLYYYYIRHKICTHADTHEHLEKKALSPWVHWKKLKSSTHENFDPPPSFSPKSGQGGGQNLGTDLMFSRKTCIASNERNFLQIGFLETNKKLQ